MDMSLPNFSVIALPHFSVISLSTVILLLILCTQFIGKSAHRTVVKRDNCQHANRYPHKDRLLGLDLFLNSYSALRAGRYLESYRGHFRKYGNTFEALVFGKRAVFTAETYNIDAVLSSNFDDYNYDPARKWAWSSVLGHSILTADGAAWSESRRLLRPSFAKRQVGNLVRLERHVSKLIEAIHRQRCETAVVDLQPLLFRMTLDTTTDLLFADSDLSLLSASTEADGSLLYLGDAFTRMLHTMGVRQALGKKLASLVPNTQYAADHARMLRFIDRYVQKALTDRNAHVDTPHVEDESRRYVFLEEVAAATDDAETLRANLLSILFAGRDTTAILIGNLWFTLARHPSVFTRLQLEIAELEGRVPTLQQLQGFKYLTACINESLRIHPPVPINSRIAIRDTVLPTGGGPAAKAPIFVPKGTTVNYHVHAVHHREDLWGADAAHFRPERWEEGAPPSPWAHLPFSGGRKVCLGQEWALTEAAYTTVRLLQEFESVAAEGQREAWREYITVVCASKDGVKVSLTPRSTRC